ncbi:MAG: cupin domain-containing protein [Devosia sp.]|jgi:putative transcriptional regulator|uniref:ChrR family anti-sigma-E factor n=1 Tax=unclassified Devosia TaxID=196773 RepID=UPI0019DFE0DE|nr:MULTISPECIES: ChrR family anti-sigma-E factor [unclassified Devosia]MBF0678977.1 cupin domain-containing protein [Devosia sp.]WEJ33594.1 ChrR family anti-sigma-E factor [Devosia sp. SD17-2]
MTHSHHVSDELLVSYEAGSLAEGWSLAVATHLHSCPECRERARAAASIGGAMLEEIEVTPLRAGALSSVLERLDATPVEAPPIRTTHAAAGDVPSPLRRYIGANLESVAWRKLGTAAQQFIIPTGDSETSVRLLRIPAGTPVPEHGHRGLELTVVLRGTLVDEDDRFTVGEIEEGYDGLEHQPRAGEDGECICLAVTDAPLRFKSPLLRLLQPILKI